MPKRRGGGRYQGRRESAAPEGRIIRGTLTDLGDLGGEVVEPVLATFRWFGKEFRVNPDLTETAVVDLIESANDVDVDGGAGLMSGLKEYLRGHIHVEDFDEFWSTAKANRQGVEQLLQLSRKILELLSERPTTPPSDSADGRPITSQSLPDGASDQVDAGSAPLRPDGPTGSEVANRWITRYEQEDRPDLAAQVYLTAVGKEAALARPTG
jgi:hypothetical protein